MRSQTLTRITPIFILAGLLGLFIWHMTTAVAAPTATIQLCTLPNARIDTGDTTYEGDDIIVSGCQGEINGSHTFNSLTIQNNSTLIHGSTLSTSLTINNNVTIESGSSINLTGRGYAGGTAGYDPGDGPGGGQTGNDTGGGGGHGGFGGARRYQFSQAGAAYGDPYHPDTLGSGGASCAANAFCSSPGGDGGAGGGAIHLNVAGTLTIDGDILANGANATLVSGVIPGSGGAGGSIWLEAAAITGSGQILANGGNGAGDRKVGGGGGRIAIYAASNTFSGIISAQGGQTELGGGYTDTDYAAGAGTIYLRNPNDTTGAMIIANRPLFQAILPNEATTPLDGGLVTPSEPHHFTTFDISGSALVSTGQPVTITNGSAATPGLWSIQGRFAGVTTTLGSGVGISVTSGTTETVGLQRTVFDGLLTMDASQDLRLAQSAWVELREPLTVDEVVISGGSRLGHVAYRSGINPTLDITANSLTIAADSQINVNGRGYGGAPAGSNAGGEGPGGATVSGLNGSGGGYGGNGGGPGGGITYGTANAPADLGSGGGAGWGGGGSTLGAGGNGGGRVRLTIAGTLALDGGIYADGGSGGNQQRDGGGGSGGSIWVTASSLSGTGQISANGGTGHDNGGGGGGGRIFLDVTNDSFNGTITVAPGTGTTPQAGLGTIIPGDLFGVSQTAVPTPALIGQPITYTLQVRNNSTNPITATITHTLPYQVTPTGQQSWQVTIPGGDVWTQDVTATVDGSASGTLSSQLAAAVNGVTRSSTLQTDLADAAISGLTAVSDSPTLDTIPVNFTASVTGGSGISYSWDFGDGAAGSGRITDHIYPAPGIYTATVTASNSVNSVQASTVVTITDLPNFRGLVWHDLDGDGLQGAGEPGLSGATITADGPGGTLTDNSSIDGSWRINTAVGGTYTLDAALSGYILTTDPPPPLPLPDMGAAVVVDFGMTQPPAAGQGSFVGRAFADANGNGAVDAGETGLSGVTVELLENGSVTATAVTDTDGFYTIANIAPGVYTLRAAAPTGYYPATLTTGDLSVATGQVQSAQFGFVSGGEVSGSVTSGSYGVSDVTLILQEENGAAVATAVTNASGGYTFSGIAPGTYQLRILPPPEYLLSDGQDTRQITMPGNGQVTENWDLLRQGRLLIHSYLDDIIPFVPVGNTAFVISPTTGITTVVHTNGNGEAILDGLDPGLYTILPDTGTNPSDATFSPAQRQVNISLNTSSTADFFINIPRSIRFRCERWVSSSVPHGPAFPCLVSATVVAGGSQPPGTEVATAQLSGERVGLFTGLTPGSYRITITPDPAVSGQTGWPVHEEVVVLGNGDHREVAYPYNPTGSAVMIWGYAFYDRNQDGSRQSLANEANDSAANGLTVSLLTLDGTLVMTTTTQPNATYGPGYYEFPNLTPDSYRVEITLGTGQFATTPISAQRVVNAISPPEEVIFGYTKGFNATIQGTVFFDNDADGTYASASDDLIGGATVTLQNTDGTTLDTTTTAADGSYNFYPLTTGEYRVVLTPPGSGSGTMLTRETAVPEGNSSVMVNYALLPDDGKTRALVYLDQNFDGEPQTNERMAGVTVTRHHNGCPPIATAADTAVTNADGLAQFDTVLIRTPICLSVDPAHLPAGTIPAFGPDGDHLGLTSANGFVWLRLLPAGVLTVHPFWDMDGDLYFDANEPVISGVSVSIPNEGTVRSTTAGASFSLNQGSYAVTVSPPNGLSVPIIQPQWATVGNGGASTLAIPMRYSGEINGTLQASGGSPPWANVTVILENVNSGAVQTTTAATANGYFSFNNAAPGTYRLRLQSSPPGWALASEPLFYYASGSTVSQPLTLVRLGSVTGLVYADANGNGVKNGNESVTGSYDVTLTNNAGLPEQTVDVAADGTFAFSDLMPGVQYAVTLDLGGGQFGAPGVAITQNPGWFTVGSAGLDVRIGLYPYPYSSTGSVNAVYGRVYEQVGAVKNPHAGAVLGYRRWNDNGGCANNNPILGTTTSDVNGYYRLLTDFIPSTWEFYCIVLLELPGMAQTNPSIVADAAYYYQSTNGMVYYPSVAERDVVVAPSGGVTAQRMNAAGEVSWLAFRDDNGNGWRDGDEPALAGATVSAGAVQASSGADGSGLLAGLAAGDHLLTISPPEGYAVVGPAERMVWLGTTAVSLGEIGFRPTGWLVGSVFVDEDGDGWRALDESGLGGITVTLSGPVVTNTVTAPNGTIMLPGLPDGSYAVSLAVPAGYAPPPTASVSLANGGVLSLGLQPDGHVSGAVYDDWDGDGLRLPDEPLLVHPVTMTLGTDETTLRAGKFLFWNVAAGDYDVGAQFGAVAGTAVSPQAGGGVALPSVPAGMVRGTVWYDANGDSVRQSWEVPLSGVTVLLAGEAVVTDENGRFTFIGVNVGSHALDAALPDGLAAAVPPVIVTDTRGAVVGVSARPQSEFNLYLPLVLRP